MTGGRKHKLIGEGKTLKSQGRFDFHIEMNANSKITRFTAKIIHHELELAETKHQNWLLNIIYI